MNSKLFVAGSNPVAVAICRHAAILALTAGVACGSNDSSPHSGTVPQEAVDPTADQPVDQSSDQPADQPADQPISQPTSEPASTPQPAAPTCDATVHPGPANFFDPTTADVHACGFGQGDPMGAALSPEDYNNAMACGSCAEVTGRNGGKVLVRVVDLCTGCSPGTIELSKTAFERLGSPAMGLADVTWRFVPCETTTPILYYFAPASNPWWLAVQVRNHEHAISKLEFRGSNGEFIELPRTAYNYFVAASGIGSGPFTFRVTDQYGQQLVDENIPLTPDTEVAGTAQFPRCSETAAAPSQK